VVRALWLTAAIGTGGMTAVCCALGEPLLAALNALVFAIVLLRGDGDEEDEGA
jgi:hypothetical protein